MIENFKMCWRKAFVWRGRADRREFWLYFALNVAVQCILIFASLLTGNNGFILLALLAYCTASIFPTIAVIVRRYHDTNKNAWWLIVYPFLPVVLHLYQFMDLPLFILFVLMMCERGTPGENAYGKA
ncbi:MAG: DUF805 domain-containing protein [Kiritimatiellae bacterium]|nr:DUF805 domain-containing protein [Kiritimatiellia bacterium]